jgi:hypothetical protein
MSGVPENLKGRKFNSWLVIEYVGHSIWHCVCDCGNEKDVNAYTLKIGTSTCCGTCNNYPKDLSHIQFGRLTAIENIGKYELNNDDIWKCYCSCGNTTIVLRGNLIKGNTKSCGCIKLENSKYNNPMKRPEIVIKFIGNNSPSKRPEVRKKISDSHKGELNPAWQGGISKGRYCGKWTNELRERIRAYFNYECMLCGKSTKENGKALSCHHVEYNKQACCDDKPVHFAALCQSCHSKTGGKYVRSRWKYIIHRVIEEIYNNKSYYTKKEYLLIKNKRESNCD